MTTEHLFGGTIVRSIDIDGVMSLQMIPASLREKVLLLPEDTDYAAMYADSMAQVKILGDA